MKNENTKDIAVIGGGFSGLILANHLALSGHQITLIEAGPQLGGLAGTFEQNGYQVDKFYHHFFQQDEELLELISQLGLDDELIESKTKSGFYFDGSWYDVSSPLQLLSFKPLSFFERISFGQTLLKARSEQEPLRLDDVSVKEWLNLEEGTGLYTVFNRMLQGKFGIGVDEVSAAFLSDRFRARSQKRSVSSKKESFFYLKNSLSVLIDSMETQLIDKGVRIYKNLPVSAIERTRDGFELMLSGDEKVNSNLMVSTINPAVFAKISTFLSSDEKERLSTIDYGSVVCSVLGLDRAISPFYWGTICDPSVPFQLLADQTKLTGVEQYKGDYVYYASRYCSQEELQKLDLENHENEIRKHLDRISYTGEKPKVLWQKTFINADSTPIFAKGYQKAINSFPDLEGVWMTGMPFIYPFARNLNSMIRIARKSADSIAQSLSGERVSSYSNLHEQTDQ